MSSKDFYSAAIVPTGAMTGVAVIYSQPFDIRYQVGCSFEPAWTGTPTGVFTVQVSDSYVPNLQNPAAPINAGNWTTWAVSIPAQPSGSGAFTYFPIFGIVSSYIRLMYTNSSGVGVLGGQFTAKTWG